jgi:hypothetical protein
LVSIGVALGRLQAELLDSIADLIAIDPQELCGPSLVSAGPFECLGQKLTLDLL